MANDTDKRCIYGCHRFFCVGTKKKRIMKKRNCNCAKDAAVVLLSAFLLLLCGCSRVQYVPVETVRTDSVYLNRVERDSIHVRDSVYIREKGDTVWMERWHTVYRDKVLRDTCYMERRDSVAVPYPVERELTFEQRFWIASSKVLWILLAVLLAVLLLCKTVKGASWFVRLTEWIRRLFGK